MQDGSVSFADKTFTVTGTFNKIDDWTAFPVKERTGYYLPIVLTGEPGTAIKLTTLGGNEKVNVFGKTQDPEGTMVLVAAINSNTPTRTFTAYKNEANAAKDKDGTVYTINCADAIFAGVLPVQ